MTVNASVRSWPSILHVSGDFPDSIQPFKTPVIRSFLELSAHKFDHQVISINRKSPTLGLLPSMAFSRNLAYPHFETRAFDHGTALGYLAPGQGIFHQTRLEVLGDWLVEHISRFAKKPDLLMAHKLTIEGIAVRHAAQRLKIPFALTIQGNTDRRIIAARPDLRALFRSIYNEAVKVLTFTPIAKSAIEKKLGKRADGIRLVPCPTELDEPVSPKPSGNGLISVFHLKNQKVKNLHGMSKALQLASGTGPAPRLAVIGGGTEREAVQCEAIASGCPSLTFEGALDREKMRVRMHQATALVQPSLSESFGLVFIEALFAGLPIIYPADTGIDGYFDGADFALRVDPRSPSSILDAMQRALAEEHRMKAALAEWQQSEASFRFTRQSISASFIELLTEGLANRPAFQSA